MKTVHAARNGGMGTGKRLPEFDSLRQRPTGNAYTRVKAQACLRFPADVAHTDPLDAPIIVSLTRRFRQLRRSACDDAVEAVTRLGSILIQGRPRLRGHYERWLGRLHLSRATAKNYAVAARLAQEHPRVFAQLSALGPTKLYRVARLSHAGRKHLMGASVEELVQMSHRSFARLTRPYIERGHCVTADMRAHGLRMKVQATAQALRQTKLAGIRSAEIRSALRAGLRDLARAAQSLARLLRRRR